MHGNEHERQGSTDTPRNPPALHDRGAQAPYPAVYAARARQPMTSAMILQLQRAVGNGAVLRLLAERQNSPGVSDDLPDHPQGPDGASPTVQRSTVPEVLRSPGRPLAEPVRAEMEARLGADFTGVRLHDGPAAARSAAEVGARAYTSGEHVVVGRGGSDKHTLAHELTHVIQQRSGPVAGTATPDGLSLSDPSDRFERAAEANALKALSGPVPLRAAALDSAHCSPSSSHGGAPDVQRTLVVQDWGADDEAIGTVTATELCEDLIEALKLASAADQDIAQEIITRYRRSKTEFSFTFDSLQKDVRMRLTLIAYMGYVNSEASPYAYNLSKDIWTMPKAWRSVIAWADDKNRTKHEDGVAFTPADASGSWAAVKDLFRGTGSENSNAASSSSSVKYFTDCSAMMVAMHYGALASALSEHEFNKAYKGNVIIAPEGYEVAIGELSADLPMTDAEKGHVVRIDGQELAKMSLADLVPGDWVYFENYPDYEDTHKGGSAAWAGEHSLYMGNGRFQGFGSGTSSSTHDEMVQTLIDAYNKQGVKVSGDKKFKPRTTPTACLDSNPSIGELIPGITEVRRLKQLDG